MELDSTQTSTTAKLPMLKQGDYEMWRLKIKQYFQKDAKTLFAAIESRFGRNEATKKNQKSLLKQLAVLGVFISLKDLNLKFLRSLPSEWNTHVVVLRNKSDLDTMSIDDLYNNFKIIKQEVKETACSNSSSQNMAFVSSPNPSSTNEVPNAYGVSTASTQSSTTNTKVSTANLSDATVINGFEVAANTIKHDGKEVFQKTRRKITINGSDTTCFDKSKVENYNYHKMRHFSRECIHERNQDSRSWNQDSSRRTLNIEETPPKAMASKSLDKLIGSQITNKSRKGVGFESYNDVPPPPIGLFSPPKIDLSYSDLEEFQQPEFESYGPKSCKIEFKNASEIIPNELKESTKAKESVDVPLGKKLVSDDKLEKKTVIPTDTKIELVKAKQQEKSIRKPVKYAEMYRSQGPRGN
nr:hypothetical protein [Tanacetum cinerariifolium]